MENNNYINQKIGMLTILEFIPRYKFGKYHNQAFKVRCDCGKEYIRSKSNVLCSKYPDTLNCGCRRSLAPGEAILNLWFQNITGHKKRGIDNCLTRDEAIQIGYQNCFYCNKTPEKFGRHRKELPYNGEVYIHSLDRVNQSIGYTLDNCVACCHDCNFLKHKWDAQKWYDYLEGLYNHKTNPQKYIQPSITQMQRNSLDSIRSHMLKDIPRRTQRNLETGILNDLDKFVECVLKPCHYCGKVGYRTYPRKKSTNPRKLQQVSFNGLDRIKSDIGYLEDNVLPACFICNQGRSGDPNTPELSVEDFIEHLDRLVTHWPILKPKLKVYLN